MMVDKISTMENLVDPFATTLTERNCVGDRDSIDLI